MMCQQDTHLFVGDDVIRRSGRASLVLLESLGHVIWILENAPLHWMFRPFLFSRPLRSKTGLNFLINRVFTKISDRPYWIHRRHIKVNLQRIKNTEIFKLSPMSTSTIGDNVPGIVPFLFV